MVLVGQLFLRLISSKLFSAHTHKHQKLHRQDKTLVNLQSQKKEKRLWSGKFHYSRKWVDKWRPRQRDLGGLKMSLFVVGIPSFVRATPVAIRLWIVSQEQDLNPSPLPALVQLFPVWNWLLGFGGIKVFASRDQCYIEKTAYLFTFGSFDAGKLYILDLFKYKEKKE